VKVGVAPGAVVGKLAGVGANHENEHHYVVNGFYLDMRDKFIDRSAAVHFFMVQFNEDELSWHDFRKKVIGATNPEKALPGSLRNAILQNWKELGLKSRPNYGDNGVHASAGPIEAFRERLLWTSKKEENPFSEQRIKEDPLGKRLIAAGIDVSTIDDCLHNVVFKMDGASVTAFDETEDMNTSEGIRRIMTIKSVAESEI